ncbi:MAG TPA: hypothetical protein PKB10_06675 [Tepidisphaeraceae bacterium]|nr:hypothetical protein [Tepidisphaeraceae bacterium]
MSHLSTNPSLLATIDRSLLSRLTHYTKYKPNKQGQIDRNLIDSISQRCLVKMSGQRWRMLVIPLANPGRFWRIARSEFSTFPLSKSFINTYGQFLLDPGAVGENRREVPRDASGFRRDPEIQITDGLGVVKPILRMHY